MRSRWQHLGRMDRRRLSSIETMREGLIALLPLRALTNNASALVSRLVAIAPKHGDMQQDIRPTIVRDDKPMSAPSKRQTI